MADVPISGLSALGAAPAVGDLVAVVDISDTTQAPTGTTKKMTTANLFTSPTMTSVTVTSGGVLVSAGGVTVIAGGISVVAGTTAVQALTATAATITTSSATAVIANWSGGAGVLGPIAVQRSGSTKYFLGLNGSDEFALLNAGGGTANLSVTDLGAATIRAGLSVGGDLAINTTKFTVTAASGNVNTTGVYQVSGTQVVSARNTGWAAQSGAGSASKSDIGTIGTWTATSVGALLLAHHAALVAHGLIGT